MPTTVQPVPAQDNTTNGRHALAQALQRSEGLRARLLLGVLLCLILLATIRYLTGGVAMNSPAYPARLIVLGGAAVYTHFLVRFVRRADSEGRLLHSAFWVGTALFESTIPTINILSLLKFAPIDPLEAVVAPAMIVYFLFIIISVLRRRPGLCLVTGASAGVQHAVATIWTLRADGAGVSLYPYYLSYSALILIAGGCAWIVTRAIRTHVHAGLVAADARAELAGVRRNLEIARDIQLSLLPRETIRVPGFEVAAWSRSADETGGDYYDWIQLPDGRIAVVIADVTGHGVGPALLMAMCRAYTRASVPAIDPLRTAIKQLNRLVSEDFDHGRFVTLAVAVLRPDRPEIDLISAGHGPSLLYRKGTGDIETFEGDGLPLGIVPDEEFVEPRTLNLGTGDVLVLLTDGFMEAHGEGGEMYGISRLSASILRHADRPINEVLTCIDEDVREFSGTSPQTDDMTAVVIRRLES